MASIREAVMVMQAKLKKVGPTYGEIFVKRVKDKNPPGDVTGDLRAAWDSHVEGSTVVITNKMKYASFVEYGTSKMTGRFPMTSTKLESDQILEEAVKKAGL